MAANAYSLATLIMRYVFVGIILYILSRIIYHSVSEYQEQRRALHWLQDGYARHIEFLPPYDTQEGGYVLVRSNLIGRSPRCDIYIDDRSVRRRHALLFEKRGEGYIRPKGRAKIWINGERPQKRTALLHDGDLVRLGQVEFHYKLKRTPWEGQA
ncbi:MAG: FHA domain-containing protein [Candidatus Pelethousia sp.]|nr:FHA domain-containing protein [Candidatus Pelethousia sp.]